MNGFLDRHSARLYWLHTWLAWGGASWQIAHIYSHQSAQDITLVWAVMLLLKQLVAIPESVKSGHLIWKWCHRVGAVLFAVLLVGVILWG